jgi:protein-S-isoprenylcysteine O-methyltransferase Ste14
MILDGLRLYLLGGLVLHKLVWEVLKRRQVRDSDRTPRSRSLLGLLLQGVKLIILLGLVVQTVAPEVFPISEDPTALRVAGVALYTLGLALAILGRWQLGDNWADIEAAQILRRQEVVATGIYRYVRHPIYTGDVILLVGLELSLNSWLVLAVGVLVPYVVWRAVREERMLSRQLQGYDAYCERTYRFVPFVV